MGHWGANMLQKRRQNKQGTPEGTKAYTPEHAAEIIAAHTTELATIAKNSKLETLEYILVMAGLEAHTVLAAEAQKAA